MGQYFRDGKEKHFENYPSQDELLPQDIHHSDSLQLHFFWEVLSLLL